MPREYVKFDVDGNPYIDPKVAKIIDKAWRAGEPATQLKHAQKGDSRGEDTLLESGQEYKDVKKECRVGDVYVGLRATGKNATFLITDVTRKGFTSIPGFTCHHEGLQKDKDGVKCQSCSIAVSYLPYGRMRDFRFDDPRQKNGRLKARDAVIRDLPRAVRNQLSDMVVATTVLLPPFSQGRNASLGYTMFHYNQAEEFTWDNHNIVRQLGFMRVDEAKKMSEARMTVETGDLYMTRAGIEKGRLRSVVEQNLPQEKLWTEEEWTAAKNKLKHIKNGSAIQATEATTPAGSAPTLQPSIVFTTKSGATERYEESKPRKSLLHVDNGSTVVPSSLFTQATTASMDNVTTVQPSETASEQEVNQDTTPSIPQPKINKGHNSVRDHSTRSVPIESVKRKYEQDDDEPDMSIKRAKNDQGEGPTLLPKARPAAMADHDQQVGQSRPRTTEKSKDKATRGLLEDRINKDRTQQGGLRPMNRKSNPGRGKSQKHNHYGKGNPSTRR